MILKALVIDDEPLAHDIIDQYVSDIDFIEIIGHFHLATEALSFLNHEEVDLIFLDIQMPKLKGTDFLRTLQKKPAIIITSAYEDYALESFELDVTDYLLKPFRFDRFLKAVNKVYKLSSSNKAFDPNDGQTELPIASEKTASKIMIKVDKRHLQLDVADIRFLESYGNYVKVWMESSYHLTPRTLTSFEEQLENEGFLRVHKSFIINKSFVHFLEGNRVWMKNEQEVPIGKSYKQEIKDNLL